MPKGRIAAPPMDALGRWMISQAKKTWRQGKCLWDWDAIRAQEAAEKALKAATKAARRKRLREIGKAVEVGG